MKNLAFVFFILLLNSCAYVPELAKMADDIATDDAIKLEIDRDAIKKDTDIHMKIDILNKDNVGKEPI